LVTCRGRKQFGAGAVANRREVVAMAAISVVAMVAVAVVAAVAAVAIETSSFTPGVLS
jgi:hypothetical protein